MSAVDRAKQVIASLQETWLGRLVQRYSEDRGGLLAAVVAYNALFSMFPLILAILAIIGLVLQDPDVRAQAQDLVVQSLPPSAQSSVLEVVEGTSRRPGLFGLIGLLGLFWSGSGLFGALEVSFNQIYRVAGRSFVKQKLMSVGMILLFATAVLVVLAASSLAQVVSQIGALGILGPAATVLISTIGWAISALAAIGLCFAIYYVVPNLRLAPRQVMPGAVFTGVVLLLLAQLFPLYVRLAGGFNQYGALFGLFFLLMTWNYLVAQGLLIGAEINAFVNPPTAAQRDKRGRGGVWNDGREEGRRAS